MLGLNNLDTFRCRQYTHRMVRFTPLLVALLVVLVLTPRDAHAYLDPGTGSFLLQMLIAGVVGALYYIRVSWARIKGYFGGTKATATPEPAAIPPVEDPPSAPDSQA